MTQPITFDHGAATTALAQTLRQHGLKLATAESCTGGLIASLADNAMGYSCAQALGWEVSLVTINLAVDYIGSAGIGQWLSVESDVIKSGRTICFAQSLVLADDTVIARANATFRLVPKPA